jgi:hypothetical protein
MRGGTSVGRPPPREGKGLVFFFRAKDKSNPFLSHQKIKIDDQAVGGVQRARSARCPNPAMRMWRRVQHYTFHRAGEPTYPPNRACLRSAKRHAAEICGTVSLQAR